MTELETLKAKCYNKNGSVKKGATAADLTRLKQLQDGEPLSAADLEVAKQREEDRVAQDKADYEARQQAKVNATTVPEAQAEGMPNCFGRFSSPGALDCTTVCRYTEDCKKQAKSRKAKTFNSELLDPPPEHPRIVKLKDALRIFTQIEAHDSRPDDFVLFTRGVSITAGDVRRARKAMML